MSQKPAIHAGSGGLAWDRGASNAIAPTTSRVRRRRNDMATRYTARLHVSSNPDVTTFGVPEIKPSEQNVGVSVILPGTTQGVVTPLRERSLERFSPWERSSSRR